MDDKITKIDKQIAHMMAMYGDEPAVLFDKLQLFAIEWYARGLEAGIQTKHEEMEKQIEHRRNGTEPQGI